jgi:hypothetical protein
MHLPSFLKHHVELAHRAAAEGWSHVRYLVELVALEASELSDRRMTRLLGMQNCRATGQCRRWI